MVSRSKRLSGFVFYLFNQNKILSLLIAYQLLATLIYNINLFDIRIPCLFTLLFNVKCYGCGLSESFAELFKLNILKAIEINFLIVPVFFLSVFYLVSSYKKFMLNS